MSGSAVAPEMGPAAAPAAATGETASPSAAPASSSAGEAPSQTEVLRLFHRLNNQLGVILANAELLESRLVDETQRARAGQVVAGALDAIATIQRLRRMASPSEHPLGS